MNFNMSDLLKKIIEHSSKKRDLILDPFCGSGSTCVACKKMERDFIGIELEEKWVEVCKGFAYKLSIQTFKIT
jgi:site-specific DNA-methyltransferase (adenine-specific)